MSPPKVLIISKYDNLFQKTFAGLLTALRANSELLEATSRPMALEYLHCSEDLAAVLVTDPFFIRPNMFHNVALEIIHNVALEIIRYAKEGGTVIFGCFCNEFEVLNKFDEFFERAFSLPWTLGTQYRTTFSFNPWFTNKRFTKRVMPKSYSMEAVNIARTSPESQMYVSTNKSMIESSTFPIKPVIDHSQSPVLFADFERGHIGWVGE